jgi:hypothetical protein
MEIQIMTTLLERRKIEALFAKAIYEEILPELGEEKSLTLLGNVARKLALDMGQKLAEEKSGETNLHSFSDIQSIWRAGGALEIEEHEQRDDYLAFDVVRCRYADMYREIGAEKLGASLSCNRDGTLCEGYDKRIKMQRTKTIMEGFDHCDFRYTFKE